MAEHPLALLDTSCIIDPPADLIDLAEAVAISTLSIAELAYGLHTADPVQAALREQRYRQTLSHFEPVPYSAGAAHWYGAIAALVRQSGRSPRPRRLDLLLASVAADLSAVLVTRNPRDFVGAEKIVTIVPV